MRVEVRPATADRFDDVTVALGGQPCWCLYYRLSAGEYRRTSVEARAELMRERLRQSPARSPAPGMVAYADEEPVGWCGFGPRSEFERLRRSRTIQAIDDRPVWSVVCFLVRPGFRRKGLAHAMLAGTVEYARAEHAAGLEGYPVDPGGKRIDTTFAYVGTTGLFEAAGFRRVAQTNSHSAGLVRWVMRLDLMRPDLETPADVAPIRPA
jgi:GNAT superfamily N-acetyltransferase